MKIYHTETQADYDALMVELERLGIQTLKKRLWKENDNQTVVLVRAIGRYIDNRTDTTFGGLARALKNHPRVPIIKYKAKADEKMRFNKQNIERAFDKFMQGGNDSFADLKERIINLVDEPKKVVVPKCFDEWYKEIEAKYPFPDSAERFALWKLCQKGFGYDFERANGERICYKSELGTWLKNNTFSAIDAVLNGYTIEPEQFYYIPLPYLETSDGIQQVLSKRKNGTNYFASRPNEKLKQRYTKEEVSQVPEIYKLYATLIEEEAND